MTYPQPERPIRAIAFDMDGVLASSEDVYLRTGTETLGRRGKPFEDALRHKMIGLPTLVALQTMIDWHDLDIGVEEFAEESERTFWELASDDLQPMPGVHEMFDRIDAAGLPRGVVTSGAHNYAERILTIIGVRDRLDFVITADDVRVGKPDPEPYLLAVERTGCDAARSVAVEDSTQGAACALGAGLRVFTLGVVVDGASSITSLRELLDVVG